LSAEAVILWASAAGCLSAAALEFGRNVPESNVLVWKFQPPGGGTVFATPAFSAAGDKLFVTAAHGNSTSGAVYCVDAETGRRVWSFNGVFTLDATGQKTHNPEGDDFPDPLKGVFCSPAVADGKVYFGEGFHQDRACRLYCLDAETGKPAWKHPFYTQSHTESTPVIVAGKVYFGAGDDGVYCLDAKTGDKVWHLHGLHVDGNVAVADGRLYGGSGTGIGNLYNDKTVFCLDLTTPPEPTESGTPRPKELWRLPVEDSAFGSPQADGDRVYFGTGNGDMIASAASPRGAVLCISKDGTRLWQRDLPDAVLGRATAANGRVFVGCRDGFCYALSREDGSVVWKSDVGGPVVTTLAVPVDTAGKAKRVYAAVSTGLFQALDAGTGKAEWSFDVPRQAHKPAAFLFSSPATRESDGRRRFWFGAGLGEAFSNPSMARVYCLEEPQAR
jgi:outer membrane protein assembly factor BamB